VEDKILSRLCLAPDLHYDGIVCWRDCISHCKLLFPSALRAGLFSDRCPGVATNPIAIVVAQE